MPKHQKASDEQLVRAFYIAAIWLIDKVEREGWYWRTNYIREHAGCTTGIRFTNSRSPGIYRLLARRNPELKEWLKLKPCATPTPGMFKQVELLLAQARKAAERELNAKN